MRLPNILDISIPYEYADICYYFLINDSYSQDFLWGFPYFAIPPKLYK